MEFLCRYFPSPLLILGEGGDKDTVLTSTKPETLQNVTESQFVRLRILY